ncbi:hypothetical protein sscle_06g055070 [Sclerotinia sclerotiorum 1980 UF-70]|uniref:Major facilitator superfamily (MFS) profile domain-containing protein n=1 Tax=Sclerotinia sclerotiorum (strain ATCC 18683 / 1980 / Ss-1) TaxID=665079 RepID=A0A1D9Q731_SCLS1|nr:hypothetical protein sscle_06g055070 [Sclerotinia sclerotiorum 1980 UF-70]
MPNMENSADISRKSEYLQSWRLGIVITSLFIGAFLIALDVNIINVPIPNISTEFNSLPDVAWYDSAYLLTITAFQPTFGTLYKYFRIDVTYRACIILFEVGSVVCAAAPNSKSFIVGRAIAGLGAAGMLQGALAVIGQVVELSQRSFYMGVVISVFIITVCVGPVLGGVFTQTVSWRWCFWINVPIGGFVLCILFVFLNVPGTKNHDRSLPLARKLKMLDPIGCLLFLGSIACLLLALQWAGQTKPWISATILGLFVGSATLMTLFAYVQWKREDEATIPPRVLFQRSLWTGAFVLFFLGATTSVVSFYIPFFFRVIQEVSPIMAGVRFIPLMLPQMVSLILVGGIVTLRGYYIPYMIAGELICIVGLSLLTRLSTTINVVSWASALVVTGFGMGMAMQLPYTAVQVCLDEKNIPTGNAIAVFSWQLGGAIAIPIGQTIAISTLLELVPKMVPGISGRTVIAAGATGLPSIVKSAEELEILQSIWSKAIIRIMYLCIALTAASVPFTIGMEWKNSKEVASKEKRHEELQNNPLEPNQPSQ